MESKRRKPTATLPEFALPEEELRHQLVSDSNRTVLEAYLGAAHYRELQALAVQAVQNRATTGPRVYVLPGIMGSKLGIPKPHQSSGDLLWIDPEEIGRGRLTQLALPRGTRFQATDVMVPIYLKLKLKLEIAGFDVRFHSYDWRQSIETLGRELLERVQHDPAKTVLLVAHSMGGLVCRMAMGLDAQHHDKSKIGRLVMIGTPNAGSFAPVLALRGVYPAVRKITTLDLKHTPEKLAARVFNTFPGLHHLLPARECFDEFDLYDLKNWPKSDLAVGPEKKSLRPRRSILKDVARVRGLLAPPDGRFICIAGVNQDTITGLERTGDSFQYRSTCEGDSTVPVVSAVLPGIPTYYVEESHPALPTNDAVSTATIDLLQQGTTSRLAQTWQRKHGATHMVGEEELRLQDTEKKVWSTLTLEERRVLLQGLALPVSNLPNANS